jgi:hypothetical protein
MHETVHPSSSQLRGSIAAGVVALLFCGHVGAAPSIIQEDPIWPHAGLAELQLDVRERASNFTGRFALPVWKPVGAATLFQIAGLKGEESLGVAGAGVIQRFQPFGTWVFGLNGFYSVAQTSSGFDFQRVDFGVEVANGRHIVRANGWVPTTGGEVRYTKSYYKEKVSPSAGFEVEYELQLPTIGRDLQPRLAAGYYYHEATDGSNDRESGFKARAELQYGWVTTGVEWRENDRIAGGNWLGMVRVSVPLGRVAAAGTIDSASLTASRMVAPVRHDLWPKTFQGGEKPPAVKPVEVPEAPPVEAAPFDCCPGAPEMLIYD